MYNKKVIRRITEIKVFQKGKIFFFFFLSIYLRVVKNCKVRIISCKNLLQKHELRNIMKSSGLLVHLTTSEEVKANVIIVPSIDVTRMFYR